MIILKRICKCLLEAVDYFNSRIGMVSSFLLILLILIVAYEAFVRYLLNSPTTWVFEVSQIFLMVMVMLSLGNTLQKEKHVSMDVLKFFVREKFRRWTIGLTSIIGMLVCLLLAYHGLLMGLSAFQTNQQLQDTGIPLGPIKSTVFVGFLLIGVQFLVRGIKNFKLAITQKKED